MYREEYGNKMVNLEVFVYVKIFYLDIELKLGLKLFRSV